jgi:hypothetical protein
MLARITTKNIDSIKVGSLLLVGWPDRIKVACPDIPTVTIVVEALDGPHFTLHYIVNDKFEFIIEGVHRETLMSNVYCIIDTD